MIILMTTQMKMKMTKMAITRPIFNLGPAFYFFIIIIIVIIIIIIHWYYLDLLRYKICRSQLGYWPSYGHFGHFHHHCKQAFQRFGSYVVIINLLTLNIICQCANQVPFVVQGSNYKWHLISTLVSQFQTPKLIQHYHY